MEADLIRKWLEAIDKSLDPTLAVSLAGLTIALAIFVLSFNTPLAQRIAEVSRVGIPKPEDIASLNATRDAVKELYRSFYCFVVFLVFGVLVDPVIGGGQVPPEITLLAGDVVISGAATAGGVIFLWRGARVIKVLVLQS